MAQAMVAVMDMPGAADVWVGDGIAPHEAMRRLARSYTPRVIEVLSTVMETSESDTARVGAAVAILDRAWGRPPQAILAKVEHDAAPLFALPAGSAPAVSMEAMRDIEAVAEPEKPKP